MTDNTPEQFKPPAHLLYSDGELRAVLMPAEIVTMPNGSKTIRKWEIKWETAHQDLLGETAWTELEDNTPSDLYGLDLMALDTLEQWQRVKTMASTIVKQLKKRI